MRHRGGSACSLLLLSLVMGLGGVRVVDAAGRQTTAAVASARAEGGGQCLTCHRGIEDAHPKNPLPCAQCHRGDAMAPSREKAHAGMWTNPSDLRIVERTCGPCHTRIARTVKASIMAHRSGSLSGSLFPNGLQPTREGVRFSMAPEPTRPAAHPTGHPPVPGPVRRLDPPRHQLTKAIPVTQCTTCHNGGSRAGMNLRGMMEGPPEGRQTFVYEQDLFHGPAYTQQVPDVHFARGMACIDCHTEREVRGDGRIYVKRHYEVEIRCERCDGNPRTLGPGGFTSTEHPKLEEFRQPADYRWDRIVDGEGRPLQATTIEGARPFTKEAMERVRHAPYKFPNAAPAR